MKPKFFRSPLHCVKLSNDGVLYVCDRGNNRVQVFKAAEVGNSCNNPDGDVGKCGFVGEIHVAPQTAGGTSGTLNFSTDPKQSCMSTPRAGCKSFSAMARLAAAARAANKSAYTKGTGAARAVNNSF
jgi:hypothetical protein